MPMTRRKFFGVVAGAIAGGVAAALTRPKRKPSHLIYGVDYARGVDRSSEVFMSRVGDPRDWDLGCIAPGSEVEIPRDKLYFMGQGNIYALDKGAVEEFFKPFVAKPGTYARF